MKKYLAFVTMEIYPLTTGEIGRFIHNMLVTMPSSDRGRTVVILVGEALDLGLARAAFPDVRFEGLDDVAEVRDSDRYPPKNAYQHTTEWHWRSVCVLRKLLKLEQEGLAFDYIEFPDYCGLGFAATQERLFEGAFSQSTLAIRLHGTEGLNLSAEAHPTDKTTLALYDIERKSMRDCDRVIAPSMPVADHYCAFYGFDLSEWASRTVLHSLPVPTENAGVAKSCVVSFGMPLLFLSNLQSAKAPDVFVRACVGFMRLCPEYAGEVQFLSHEMNPEVAAYVEKLIPSDLVHRFRLHDSPVPKAQREQLISQGVSVFPSRSESFCLAAHEASALGSVLLLNGANPAFSELASWRDAVNCIKFDGTVESLVGALLHLFRDSPELAPVSPPSDVVPWRAIVRPVESTGLTEGGPEAPLVSVIIPNFNLGAYLPHTLSSVAASVYPNIEIIVCDDASTDPQTIELLGRLEHDFKNRSLTIVYAGYNRGLAGARNLAIRTAQGKYILTLDADDLISPDFIAKAVGALERNPDYSIVVPQTAFFTQERNEVPKMQSEYLDFYVFHGEAFAYGFFENRFSTATVLVRRTVFQELRYREDLRTLEDWDFYLRATIAGKRFIVTNELHFFYRRRQGSMVSELSHNVFYMAACCYDLRRIQRLELGSLSFPAYVFSDWDSALAAHFNLVEIRRLSDELESVRSSVAERDGQIAGLNQAVAERDGQIAGLNQAVAERDGQIAGLNQAVAERDGQISTLTAERTLILNSKSWRLTRPGRVLVRQLKRVWGVFKRTLFISRLYSGVNPTSSNAAQISQNERLPDNNPGIPAIDYKLNSEEFLEHQDNPPIDPLVKLIAFYLPQFHPFPENDKWWGKGFTEWSNVGKALPNYVGHYQPHCPIHLGYYDLRIPEVMEEQAKLAKEYGIYGFSYYFYWFGGTILMDTPLELMLANKKVDIPFCLTWANENWSRRWDGMDNDILIAQNHSDEDSLAFIRHLVKYFKDERYIRIDGKPVLIIYRANSIPNMAATANIWREEMLKHGIPGLYLISAQVFGVYSPKEFGFDASVQFTPLNAPGPDIKGDLKIVNPNFKGHIYSYEWLVEKAESIEEPDYKLFRTAVLSWDNTARKQNNSQIFNGFSLQLYKKWLNLIVNQVLVNPKYAADEKIVFVNAWNEWAEGAHLEPDRKFGYGYLQTTYDVLRSPSDLSDRLPDPAPIDLSYGELTTNDIASSGEISCKELHNEIRGIRLSISGQICQLLGAVSRLKQRIVRLIRLYHYFHQRNPAFAGLLKLVKKIVQALREGGIKNLRQTVSRFERAYLESPISPVIHQALSLSHPVLILDDTEHQSNALPSDVAVHAHIYYPDLASDIRTYLENIPVNFHYYVTTDTSIKARIIEDVFSDMPNIKALDIRVVENKGRDIAPMIVTLGSELVKHKLVLHIHTKRSLHSSRLEGWRRYLMESLLGNTQRVMSIFNLFLQDESLGILFPDYFHLARPMVETPTKDNDKNMELLLVRAGKRKDEIKNINMGFFPAGDMFWFRGKAIEPFVRMNLSAEDFDPEQGQINGTLAHAVERMFPYFASIVGMHSKAYLASAFLSQKYSAHQLNLFQIYLERGLIINPIVLFDHDIGGGTNIYTQELTKNVTAVGDSVLRVYCYEAVWFVQWIGNGDGMLFFTSSLADLFKSLSMAPILRIIVNSLFGCPDIKAVISNIVSLTQRLGATLDVKIHDFYALCPSPHLLDFEGKYCGVPQDIEVCSRCLKNNSGWFLSWYPETNKPTQIDEWRKPFVELFEAATMVTVFDQSSVEIVRRAFKLENSKVKVVPHVINYFKCDDRIDLTGPLHIGILGTLTHIKGADVVKEIFDYFSKHDLHIQLTVIGSSHVKLPIGVRVYGTYDRACLPTIVSQLGINVILMPSIVPETFSYTISEAMQMGLPIVAFDLGAQGNRVKQYELGKVVPLNSTPDVILGAIRDVLKLAKEFNK
jgi:lipopolysaccharide biosynthesis protein/glycosyltransferase involved in cell wall biosynthesis